MAKSFLGILRGRLTNRRGELRQKARLPLSVSLPAPGARRPLTLNGYTHDLSTSGLGLVFPGAPPAGGIPAAPGPTLRVLLVVENRKIQVQVAPVRSAPLRPGGGESGHLIGARIVELAEGDRALLAKHLKKLRLRVKDHAP